jgi:hypothetical protein
LPAKATLPRLDAFRKRGPARKTHLILLLELVMTVYHFAAGSVALVGALMILSLVLPA